MQPKKVVYLIVVLVYIFAAYIAFHTPHRHIQKGCCGLIGVMSVWTLLPIFYEDLKGPIEKLPG